LTGRRGRHPRCFGHALLPRWHVPLMECIPGAGIHRESERLHMTVELGTTPEEFASTFFNSYVKEVTFGDEDPEQSIDRFYTPDFVQNSDGVEMSRASLAEHVPAARQNFESVSYTVH